MERLFRKRPQRPANRSRGRAQRICATSAADPIPAFRCAHEGGLVTARRSECWRDDDWTRQRTVGFQVGMLRDSDPSPIASGRSVGSRLLPLRAPHGAWIRYPSGTGSGRYPYHGSETGSSSLVFARRRRSGSRVDRAPRSGNCRDSSVESRIAGVNCVVGQSPDPISARPIGGPGATTPSAPVGQGGRPVPPPRRCGSLPQSMTSSFRVASNPPCRRR